MVDDLSEVSLAELDITNTIHVIYNTIDIQDKTKKQFWR